ncbi:MAG: hypothetical protein PVG20_06305 [Thioalkalispiraceae bacterium]|jgi:hypothetical protein
MSEVEMEKTAFAQWHELVKEAEEYNGVNLDEELESYLVFTLMRYTQQPELVSKIIALEYLNGAQASGSERQERMRDVGDQCLLFSGLFPHHAKRRNVKISYYVNIGKTAYHTLAELTQQALADMYTNLSNSFVELMDTLLAIRNMHSGPTPLEPLMAYELWQDTRSKQAQHAFSDGGNLTNDRARLLVDINSKTRQ